METKFKKGELVWVTHYEIGAMGLEPKRLPGVVMEVRPWVHGGSGVNSLHESYGSPAYWSHTTHEPKRSDYLVVSPSGEFQSWFDEKSLTDSV
jgi:hypothetical protein